MNICGVIILGGLFPIHFSILGMMGLKIRLEKHKSELADFFHEFELKELDNNAANLQYDIIQRKIAKTEAKYITMQKLTNSNDKWDLQTIQLHDRK